MSRNLESGKISFKMLKAFFWFTDIGFIAYWAITALHIIPSDLLFKDYNNPLMVQWNWSFIFLDLLISATGITSLIYSIKKQKKWLVFALISLVLTFCSGLQAIGYWAIGLEFDIQWWIPNLYLLVYPCFFIFPIIRELEETK